MSLKGIVSWEWGGLLMVSVDRHNILDIAGKYLFYILKSSSSLKFEILFTLWRALPGSKVPWPVLPNHKFSARSSNIVEEISKLDDLFTSTNFLQEFKKCCCLIFEPLATLSIMPEISHRQVHATGEKRHRQEQRNLQKHCAHRQVPSHCGVYFEMRSRKYTHMWCFIYEDDIKIKNKYFAAI
jgi:hypothetical protein